MTTVTVRLIRSFEYNNVKPVVFQKVDLSIKVEDFLRIVKEDIITRPGLPPPFRKFGYDTFKISHKAHGSKSGVLAIGVDDDEHLILDLCKTLEESRIENETEISLFKKEDYEKFKKSAKTEVQWMQ